LTTKIKKQMVYRIEDVDIVKDNDSTDINKIHAGVIHLNFKSVADCHTVAKLAGLEHYNILKNALSGDDGWFRQETAEYVVKDAQVKAVEDKRTNRKRQETTRKRNITKTLLALPQERKVKQSEHIIIVAEKKEIKLTDKGIWDKFAYGRSCPAMLYRYVIYVKPTHRLKAGVDTSIYMHWAKPSQIEPNDKFVAVKGSWRTYSSLDGYIVKCSSYSNPRRKDYYQLKKKKFAEDMVNAILVRKEDQDSKIKVAAIMLEATAIAELARDRRIEIIAEGDALQKNWDSNSDVNDN